LGRYMGRTTKLCWLRPALLICTQPLFMVGKSTSLLQEAQEALETDHGTVALFGCPTSKSRMLHNKYK